MVPFTRHDDEVVGVTDEPVVRLAESAASSPPVVGRHLLGPVSGEVIVQVRLGATQIGDLTPRMNSKVSKKEKTSASGHRD